ncbi:hypothetical protein H4582DRAFT_1962947 [Lactarius indigo]|nr:hypothetical protein H4582DRAFT_1962947 [Lactarius indigo]
MTWKEMVIMDEQALEAQGVAALGARRKMLKTFEVVRRKMGIDDPTAPPASASTVVVIWRTGLDWEWWWTILRVI